MHPDHLVPAIKTSLLSHVVFVSYYGNRSSEQETNLKKCLEYCHNYGIEAVLSRRLWPTDTVDRKRRYELLTEKHILERLRKLSDDAMDHGISLTCMDVEAYGGCEFEDNKGWLTITEAERLESAIRIARLKSQGPDFHLPAGTDKLYPGTDIRVHMYNACGELGTSAIAEHTYTGNRKMYNKVEYDVFGVWPRSEGSGRFGSVQEALREVWGLDGPDDVFIYLTESQSEVWAKKIGLVSSLE